MQETIDSVSHNRIHCRGGGKAVEGLLQLRVAIAFIVQPLFPLFRSQANPLTIPLLTGAEIGQPVKERFRLD